MAEFLLKVISNTGGQITMPVSSEPLIIQDDRKENTDRAINPAGGSGVYYYENQACEST